MTDLFLGPPGFPMSGQQQSMPSHMGPRPQSQGPPAPQIRGPMMAPSHNQAMPQRPGGVPPPLQRPPASMPGGQPPFSQVSGFFSDCKLQVEIFGITLNSHNIQFQNNERELMAGNCGKMKKNVFPG